MLSDVDCACENKSWCGGKITDTEIHMSQMNSDLTPQKYHEIMGLFERAFNEVQEEYARTQQASADQEDS